jgi:RNA-directed DNA polymerase
MLEKAQQVTRKGKYETIRYARFADDLVILVSASPRSRKEKWLEKVMSRVKEELVRIDLKINEDKTKIVRLGKKESFNFL